MTRLAGLFVAAALACGGSKKPPPAQPPPPPPPAAAGVVTLEVEPRDAAVEVDGSPRGTASELGGITLARGTHQIVVTKPGFDAWRGEVEVKNQTETLKVNLVKSK